MTLQNNRLLAEFACLHAAGRKALLPFLTAGYPDLETTEALLHELARHGAAICELGFPYSDPIADGPVIHHRTRTPWQRASPREIFGMVRRFRAAEAGRTIASQPRPPIQNPKSEIPNPKSEIRNPQLSLSAMVSYSIVFRHGVKGFLRDAARAGFDATVVPDLPWRRPPTSANWPRRGPGRRPARRPPPPPAARESPAARGASSTSCPSPAPRASAAACRKLTVDAVAELRRHTAAPVCWASALSSPQDRPPGVPRRRRRDRRLGHRPPHRRTRRGEDRARETLVRNVGDFVAQLLEPIR